MVGHGGSSAGSYLADPASPISFHCAVIIILLKSVPVHNLWWLTLHTEPPDYRLCNLIMIAGLSQWRGLIVIIICMQILFMQSLQRVMHWWMRDRWREKGYMTSMSTPGSNWGTYMDTKLQISPAYLINLECSGNGPFGILHYTNNSSYSMTLSYICDRPLL